MLLAELEGKGEAVVGGGVVEACVGVGGGVGAVEVRG